MKKLKNLAIMLILILVVNFIPVSAYTWGSNFGITDVSSNILETGERNVYVSFDENLYKEIKEVKLYTKVSNYIYDPSTNNYIDKVVSGPCINLNVKEDNKFTGILKEEQITSFGSYEVDKVEILLNDGKKRVSYNSRYYTSLSDNDRENGEIINYYTIFAEYIPLSIENSKFEFRTLKLGQAQNYIFDIKSQKDNVSPNKVYVTFTKVDDNVNREQVVIAEKVEGDKYSADLKLTNSLDTGNWKVSKIKVVDNYNREYELEYSNWEYFTVVSANTDIEAPKLNGIELSSNSYDGKIQEPIKFTLDITDDLSGVDSATITLTNGNKEVYVYFGEYNLEAEKYVTYYNGFTEDGTWKVKRVIIQDNAGNSIEYLQELEDYMIGNDRYVEMDFSDKTIEVVNTKKEESAEVNIEILELINNSPEVSNGNEFDLEIKFKSDVKLNSINAYYNEENFKGNVHLYSYIGYEYDENGNIIENKDGIYTFKFKVNSKEYEYLASGKYMFSSMSLGYNTKDGNYKNINFEDERNKWINDNSIVYDFSKLDIICENENEDITPPEIEYITIDKSIVTPGETVELKIKVNDDKSGFILNGRASYISLYYNGSYNDINTSISDYNEELGEYIVKVKIPEYFSTGKYILNSLYISDIANNNRNYNWYNEEDKELLSKATLLVKTDLDEKLPPEISVNINDNENTFKAPFTPIVSSEHGTIEMLLDGEKYYGEAIKKLGNHQLYIKAIGLDGSVSTKLVSFKVFGEINNETKPEDIIDQIISSPEKEVEIEVKNENKELDKSIFEAIKGEDKTISFKQNDGTVWSFNGKDITDENLEGIGNIKISVNNIPEEENKESIEGMDPEARVIHFDYHGVLPGKAKVKIKVDNPAGLLGKDLTFYYFNPETQKAEKVQGPLSIDNDGYVTVEIEHCSDYFLSLDETLHLEDPVITVEKDNIELTEGENEYIKAKVTPEDTKLEYVSSDENIVTVDENGLIIAKKEGIAKIAIIAGKITKEITVEVKKKEVPEEPTVPEQPSTPVITLEKDNIELTEGESDYINAKITPEDTKLEYISSDESIVTVNEAGLVTAKKEGLANIIVKAGEVTKEISVEVKKKVVTEEPTVPEQPEEPTIPEQPVIPEKPEVPVVPENPEQPTVPEQPEEPTTPEQPVIPEKPEVPVVPVVPENPEQPTVPEQPEEPITPEQPVIPEKPEVPVVPVVPENPEQSTVPEQPEEPTKSEQPIMPENPEVPVVPEKPTETKPENKPEEIIDDNKAEENLPETGRVVSSTQVIIISMIVIGIGLVILKKRKATN